jgi:hypothetical protein
MPLKKESTSFLKKTGDARREAKNFCYSGAWGCGGDNAHGPESKSFFASFFSKKRSPSLILSLSSGLFEIDVQA